MTEGEKRGEKLSAFQEKIDYRFNKTELLEEALTHSSFANEAGLSSFNERLEFLGDAVLELIASEKIYKENPSLDEGSLTRIRSQFVCKNSLSSWAVSVGIPKLLMLGKSMKGKTTQAIAENTAEAVFGAVFLDGGYEKAKKVISRFLESQKGNVSPETVDPKTELQELIQSKNNEVPYYETIARPAAGAKQLFKVRVTLGGKKLAEAWGANIKEAEFAAAEKVLKKIKL